MVPCSLARAGDGTTLKIDSSRVRQVALGTPTGFLAFGFGSGLSPIAPGTVGSLAALVLALPLAALPLWLGLAVVVLAFFVGIQLCGETARRLGVHDYGGIVWDEFVGMWLVLVLLPFEALWWLAAFLLFRLFDVLKPWPIGWLDRRIHGGLGIMLDDGLAAVYALIVLLPAQAWLS